MSFPGDPPMTAQARNICRALRTRATLQLERAHIDASLRWPALRVYGSARRAGAGWGNDRERDAGLIRLSQTSRSPVRRCPVDRPAQGLSSLANGSWNPGGFTREKQPIELLCDPAPLPPPSEHDQLDEAGSNSSAGWIRAGALSGISINAIWPRTTAPIKYQAGTIALPVTWISQVVTNWVVPPKAAMEME